MGLWDKIKQTKSDVKNVIKHPIKSIKGDRKSTCSNCGCDSYSTYKSNSWSPTYGRGKDSGTTMMGGSNTYSICSNCGDAINI